MIETLSEADRPLTLKNLQSPEFSMFLAPSDGDSADFSSEFVRVLSQRFCLFWLRAIWFLMSRRSLVSFLSDTNRGDLFYIYILLLVHLCPVKVIPQKTHGLDQIQGLHVLDYWVSLNCLVTLYTFVYQMVKQSPSWYLL